MENNLEESVRELYLLGKIVSEHYKGRKVVLWGNSDRLRKALMQYFEIRVDCVITILREIVNGKSIKDFHDMNGKRDEYYIVVWGRAYEENYDKLLHEFGFREMDDYVYRIHKPIILTDWDCAKKYEDEYGNIIDAVSGRIGRVLFRGFHNRIILEDKIAGTSRLSFELEANTEVIIRGGCQFQREANIRMLGYEGCSRIVVDKNCRFASVNFLLYNHPAGSTVIINENTTAEHHCELHANSGKKVIVGRDCMFSHDVHLQAGDGHTIFDVETGRNLNSDWKSDEGIKNQILIGEHVWIGARALVLNGTEIRDGSIVGAGSVVKGMFPNNCSLGGNPAKLLRANVAWSRANGAQDMSSCGRKEYCAMTNHSNDKVLADKANENRTDTIEDIPWEKCTGCGACFNSCPAGAISMDADENGFLMPVIHHQKCVRCGKCKKVCPTLDRKYIKENVACYALMAQDAVRQVSSSGGAFTLLAEAVIRQGGVVCGAAWGDDYNVSHVFVDKIEEISLLRGSKYLQSNTLSTYAETKEFLEKGKIVLYVGMPCQIDGLLHFLGRDYEHLFTVDLLCRGTASNEIFKRYLKENYKTRKIINISFKDKKPLGWGAVTAYTFENGEVERTNIYNSIWLCTYGADIMDRESCYSCRFNSPKRVGDISIGDFWGIEKYDKTYNDKKGTSIILTSTQKGDALVNKIGKSAKLFKKVGVEHAVPYNSALSSHVRNTPKRKAFFDSIKKLPVAAASDRAMYGEKYDVGIVGWWYNLNYGGMLTYYALNKAVQRMGYSVLMVRRSSPDAYMPNDNTIPMRFAKKHYHISKIYTPHDLHWVNYSCHAFISGSDQLWNPYLEEFAGPEFFLSFVNKHNLKISYASSFGNISEVPAGFQSKYQQYLDRFDGISVREDYGVELCRKYFNREAVHVCDPIFLCDRAEYEKIAEESKAALPDRFLLNFLLDPDEEKINLCRFVSRQKGISESVNFTDLQQTQERAALFGGDEVRADAPVEDLAAAYRRAEFVITDSFHGTCLAVLFNKPFLSIANRKRGEKRFISLLNWLHLSHRLLYRAADIYQKPELLAAVDYEEVNKIIIKSREEGMDWLKGLLARMV